MDNNSAYVSVMSLEGEDEGDTSQRGHEDEGDISQRGHDFTVEINESYEIVQEQHTVNIYEETAH